MFSMQNEENRCGMKKIGGLIYRVVILVYILLL